MTTFLAQSVEYVRRTNELIKIHNEKTKIRVEYLQKDLKTKEKNVNKK
jgi:hypothetical protein